MSEASKAWRKWKDVVADDPVPMRVTYESGYLAGVASREAANARLREAIDALRECNICHGQRVFMDRDSLGEMRPRGCWCAALEEKG